VAYHTRWGYNNRQKKGANVAVEGQVMVVPAFVDRWT
jgi:hypothetical protein